MSCGKSKGFQPIIPTLGRLRQKVQVLNFIVEPVSKK
jgi:hypothetical protein